MYKDILYYIEYNLQDGVANQLPRSGYLHRDFNLDSNVLPAPCDVITTSQGSGSDIKWSISRLSSIFVGFNMD